jgi:ribosomal protein S18 acetylase RimI-like enzyme
MRNGEGDPVRNHPRPPGPGGQTSPMTGHDLQTTRRLARANFEEFNRELARWSGPHGRIEERDGVVLCATGTPFPVTCNSVVRVDPDVDPHRVVDLADEWFGALGRGYTLSVLVEPDGPAVELERVAKARGLVLLGEGAPVMVCAEPPPEVAPPPGIELRRVGAGADIVDLIQVDDDAYQSLGMPAGVILEMCTATERMVAPHLISVVAHDGTVPLAAAMVLLSHGIAGVYYVGTVAAARGRGLADAVTRTVTRAAFDRGAGCVILQATQMGEPVYRRMGYVEIDRHHGWVRFV